MVNCQWLIVNSNPSRDKMRIADPTRRGTGVGYQNGKNFLYSDSIRFLSAGRGWSDYRTYCGTVIER
jgi:hypothetical protein